MLHNQRGMFLAEALVSLLLLSIGVLAMLAAADFGVIITATAQQKLTASLVASGRVEAVRAALVGDPTAPCGGFTGLTAACFPPQDYNSIPSAPTVRTVTTFADVSPDLRRVTVSAAWHPVALGNVSTAGVEQTVVLSTLLARPAPAPAP